MASEYFFSLFYFLLFFWLLNKKPFFKNNGLSTLELNLLLILKIIISCFAAYYFSISNTVDYLNFNIEGFNQFQILIKSPSSFFSDWTNDVKNYGWGGLMNDSHSLWANIRFSLIYKFIAIVDLITKGNFYLNSMIFGTWVFCAQICFFKVFNSIYSNQKLKIVIYIFLLPSFLLYTSCFHKDGIVFIGMGIICYQLFSIFKKTFACNIKNIFLLLVASVLIFLLRNYVLMMVIISSIISLAYHYFEKRKWIIIFSIYSLALILFFLPIFHGNNLAKSLTKRKQDFSIVSKGNTDILLNPLEPNVLSFVKNTPLSLNHALFRPYIFEFKGFSVNLAAFEVLLYQLLFLIFLFFRFKSKNPLHSFNFFGLTLFFHMMLIIGLTIPNIGAIVRYRSIFWLFLLTPIICNTDWKRVFKIIRFSKE